jgi:hypothetical protein
MKKHTAQWVGLLVLLGHVQIVSAAPVDIQPPKKREQVVEQASQLAKAAAPEAALPPENLRNPFNPSVVEEVHAARPTSDKDLLQILAEQLQPTGVIGREDDLKLLLKGQKGVKVNDKLTLSFDGSAYEVEITAIDSNNFSLRLNQAEITRPIKSGKNP